MATRGWTKMMVAVRDFDHQARALIRKAAALTQSFGASLEVLHVSNLSQEAFRIPGLLDGTETLEQLASVQQQRLAKLIKPLAKSGVKITALSVMDYPPAEAILRQVRRRKPDVLIVQSQRHALLARMLLTHTDWELIRRCPCPLWLVKTAKRKPALSVLAAVDPFHAHAKPADLDKEILATAGRVAGTGRGRLGMCHAYIVPQEAATVIGEVTLVPASTAVARRYKARVAEATRQLGKQYAIARRDQLLVEGEPASGIAQTAKRWKADLVVMGAVSRSGLRRIFIGNTAERALDAVHCDVLIVKPRSFRNPKTRRAA